MILNILWDKVDTSELSLHNTVSQQITTWQSIMNDFFFKKKKIKNKRIKMVFKHFFLLSILQHVFFFRFSTLT